MWCPKRVCVSYRVEAVTCEILHFKGPTRRPWHASIFNTHSDTQVAPAFQRIRMFKGIFSTRAFLQRTDTLSTKRNPGPEGSLVGPPVTLPLHCFVILIPLFPQIDLNCGNRATSMETARHYICIYHLILIGLIGRKYICICLCNVILKMRPEKIKFVCHYHSNKFF